MIQEIKKIDITEQSHPFATTIGKLGFESMHYAEEEYFIYGTSNVYEEIDDTRCKVVHSDLPYCNRFLLRRPQDMSKFSGNIIVEILNASAGIDIDRVWVCGAKELMRDGAIYVGITSKPDVIPPMKVFDDVRYADLSWKVPYINPDLENCGVEPVFVPKDRESETGLIWDMLTDLANVLRGDFVQTDVKKYIYLTAWSQSTAYLRAYVRYIAFRNKEDRIYDGYLSTGGVHYFGQPLRQAGYADRGILAWTMIEYMPVPHIALQTESEVAGFGGNTDISLKKDSDSADMKYRRYDIAGATHDTVFSLLDYYEDDVDTEKIGMKPQYAGIDKYPNDYPYEYCFYAVYRMLFDWVRNGKAPMPGKFIDVDDKLEKGKDEFGNSVGGMRTPMIEYPICTYYDYSHLARGSHITSGINPLFGHIEPFAKEKINELYYSLAEYRKLIEVSAKKCVMNGDMLEEDIKDYVDMAVQRAASLGLQN